MNKISINNLIDQDPLLKLVQPDNFIGWIYSMDYDSALVVTNDAWKARVNGVPHNSFLIASSFNPANYASTTQMEKEVILLRVIGACKLPQDDDMIRTKIDNYQNQTDLYLSDDDKGYDPITQNRLQFGGLKCRVLGTFYMKNSELSMGSDIESFSVSMRMGVYMPKSDALSLIVNYVDPIRKNHFKEELSALGINNNLLPFEIGTVRYTSTDRLHRANEADKIPFYIQPSDFLARRTAVLGMTRTGKSNMIKQTISVVKNIADSCDLPIGQLVFDINGEYANANKQDNGSISYVYSDGCERYRMIPTDGFSHLLNNFYSELQEGLSILGDLIREAKKDGSADIDTFLGMSLERPDPIEEKGEYKRWQVKTALYKTLLKKAGYAYNGTFSVKFEANKKIREAVDAVINENVEPGCEVHINPNDSLSFEEAFKWFTAARTANKDEKTKATGKLKSTSGSNWFDEECIAMLNLLDGHNNNDAYIRGFRTLECGRPYHTPYRTKDVCEEIYQHLIKGKIVILDLSVGQAQLRERISKRIAKYVFDSSMNCFTSGKNPQNIVIYIEEAHNLIGRNMDLSETWPRLAKEGAKYKIALVYATQEVSSVHPNILANTENWFISHLNSEKEISELAKFYDFADFKQSLLRSQDVGFARVKTLSSPFVVPIQINKFDPKKIITQKGK
ncbi:MAG TPA: DUF87 domain-containing protein [Oscillospiraceae bacterium]|nr:DUF87 domain-containing protein [Oscillospiraceae bacterium]